MRKAGIEVGCATLLRLHATSAMPHQKASGFAHSSRREASGYTISKQAQAAP